MPTPGFANCCCDGSPRAAPARNAEGRFTSLRLAVRNDYLTFYCAGSQIAQVKCGPESFYEKTHHKFLGLAKKGSNDYLRVDPPTAAEAGPGLTRRIESSFFKQGGEKDFVDELAGANSDLFDLEITLSHLRPGAAKPVAIRLDAAALEPHEGGWRIALYEAKLAENKGAKSKSQPATLAQHQAYGDWLAQSSNTQDLIAGCRETCRYLVRLHRLARHAGNSAIAPLGRGITAIGGDDDAELTLDRVVRYVIDARGPAGRSFIDNGHAEKLRQKVGRVQLVEDGASLVFKTP